MHREVFLCFFFFALPSLETHSLYDWNDCKKHWPILWMKSVPTWASSFYERRLAEHIFPNPVLQKEAIQGLRSNKAVFSDLSATLYSQEYVTKGFLYCYVTNYYKWISLRQLIWVLCSGCHRSAIKVLTGILSHLETWLGKNPLSSLCRLFA